MKPARGVRDTENVGAKLALCVFDGSLRAGPRDNRPDTRATGPRAMQTTEIQFTPGVSESSILSRVRSFAQGNSLYRQHGYVLDGDDRFFERVALDSKYVAAMITYIEDEFGVHVSDCEISRENLGSLRAVARFVASKQPFAVG